jgi:hypothetical protein
MGACFRGLVGPHLGPHFWGLLGPLRGPLYGSVGHLCGGGALGKEFFFFELFQT